MGAEHGNVMVFRTSGTGLSERWYVVRRDGSVVPVPDTPTGTLAVADENRLIVVPTSGDLVVRDGTKVTLPQVDTIPRPNFTGHAIRTTQPAGPSIGPSGHVWLPMNTGSGVAVAVAQWDGSSWTLHTGFGDDPPPNFIRETPIGLIFSWGAGTAPLYPAKVYDGTTATTLWDPSLSIPEWDESVTTADGTVRNLAWHDGFVWAALGARINGANSNAYSGYYKVKPSTGEIVDMFQFGFTATTNHHGVTVDNEGHLWGLTDGETFLFTPDGMKTTVARDSPITTGIDNRSLQRGPRLGPIRRHGRLYGLGRGTRSVH